GKCSRPRWPRSRADTARPSPVPKESSSWRCASARTCRPLPLFRACRPALLLRPRHDRAHELAQRIVQLVHHALLQRNDRVVGDRDALRTHLGAALRDVAVPDAVRLLQRFDAVLDVEWMHLERGGVDQEPRPDELLVQLMLAQHVTDVLTQKALDALAELL